MRPMTTKEALVMALDLELWGQVLECTCRDCCNLRHERRELMQGIQMVMSGYRHVAYSTRRP
jgi:hypothetical protein